jgi:transcriptional regulator with XRE-family HTH domain
MATTLVTMPTREVLRCEHCALVQFRTSNSLCRRCHKPLDIEELPAVIEVLAPVEAPVSNQDAGLRVAAQVKDIRKARHLSQRQLASRMQVPRTYISKIENGKAIPTLGSLERLASALEVDICQLVRDGRSEREEELAEILSDPFLAELALYLPKVEALQRSLLLNHARDRARETARDISIGKRRSA